MYNKRHYVTGLSQQLLAYYCDPKDTNINIYKYIYTQDMHETRTKYIQDTYMNVYRTITTRFTPFSNHATELKKIFKSKCQFLNHVKWYKI